MYRIIMDYIRPRSAYTLAIFLWVFQYLDYLYSPFNWLTNWMTLGWQAWNFKCCTHYSWSFLPGFWHSWQLERFFQGNGAVHVPCPNWKLPKSSSIAWIPARKRPNPTKCPKYKILNISKENTIECYLTPVYILSPHRCLQNIHNGISEIIK